MNAVTKPGFVEIDDSMLAAVVGGSGAIQSSTQASDGKEDDVEYGVAISGPVVKSDGVGVGAMVSTTKEIGGVTVTGQAGAFAGAGYEVSVTGVGASAGAGAFASISGTKTEGNVTTTVTAEAAAGIMVGAQVGVTNVGVSGVAGIGGTVSVTVETEHNLGKGVTATTGTTTEVGVKAGVEGQMSVGVTGVKGGAEVMAGAYSSITATATIGTKEASGTGRGYVDPGSAVVGSCQAG